MPPIGPASIPPPRPGPRQQPVPPPPARDARAALRASILPANLSNLAALPAFAHALEEDRLKPVRAEDFYDPFAPDEQDDLTPAQKRTLFKQAFFEERVTIEELAPYRIRVGYRLVREHLRLRGLHEEQPLAALGPTADIPDPWTALRAGAPRNLTTSAAASAALPILDAADRLTPPGLSLLPPSPPGSIAPVDYRPGNPEHDPRLHLYVNAIGTMADYLGIHEGTKCDPRLGKYGLLGMTDALTVRLVFPTRLQLVQYERLIMQETLDMLSERGRREAERSLFEKYGFQDDEVLLLFRLATQRARHVTKSDTNEDKAMMLLRLEDLLQRARAIDSYRTELMILKLMTIVQGIARVEPDDFHAQIEDAYKRIENDEAGGDRKLKELSLDDD